LKITGGVDARQRWEDVTAKNNYQLFLAKCSSSRQGKPRTKRNRLAREMGLQVAEIFYLGLYNQIPGVSRDKC
jgi:hypothetical protein